MVCCCNTIGNIFRLVIVCGCAFAVSYVALLCFALCALLCTTLVSIHRRRRGRGLFISPSLRDMTRHELTRHESKEYNILLYSIRFLSSSDLSLIHISHVSLARLFSFLFFQLLESLFIYYTITSNS